MNNAVDAILAQDPPTDRWIRVGIEEKEDQVLISVTDSGPGVPRAIARHIFRPFFTTKSAEGGTGLGLSISRSLLRENGGELSLDESSPHTRFVIRLSRQARK
jgi:C4-dicarboxylate-specific signal transduction histidine kinase